MYQVYNNVYEKHFTSKYQVYNDVYGCSYLIRSTDSVTSTALPTNNILLVGLPCLLDHLGLRDPQLHGLHDHHVHHQHHIHLARILHHIHLDHLHMHIDHIHRHILDPILHRILLDPMMELHILLDFPIEHHHHVVHHDHLVLHHGDPHDHVHHQIHDG